MLQFLIWRIVWISPTFRGSIMQEDTQHVPCLQRLSSSDHLPWRMGKSMHLIRDFSAGNNIFGFKFKKFPCLDKRILLNITYVLRCMFSENIVHVSSKLKPLMHVFKHIQMEKIINLSWASFHASQVNVPNNTNDWRKLLHIQASYSLCKSKIFVWTICHAYVSLFIY